MMRNRLYYSLKPFVPLAFRRSIRRWFALRKLDRVKATWPILPGSERPPEGWAGWPNGKQFAFVLSHDVENPTGLGRCRQLMELEMKLGFRSSFNFIPEGKYRVSSGLIQELQENEFEVGVHDLHHDGKLYLNRCDFAENALKINQYLEQWGAVGFRSGFMLRKLDWLHQLNIRYDASTFDTDPFEPQPDGTGTIFPFWVSSSGSEAGTGNKRAHATISAHGKGYVELPYTLAQDSTLFLLLRERSIDIWKQKLEWIAANGGMALVNVHPDYISFNGDVDLGNEFPVQYYEDFLRHVQQVYEGQYWHALPKDVAIFQKGLYERGDKFGAS